MRTLTRLCVGICVLVSSLAAAERPTLIKTCDPRPDILPRPFYDNHTEYRAQYNRPRFYTGYLAYKMSRTSQEAMVWQENYCAGNYDQHHLPPIYKRYDYPKPWEALTVGARPNFAKASRKTQRVPAATAEDLNEAVSSRKAKPDDETDAADPAASKVDSDDTVKEIVPSPSDK